VPADAPIHLVAFGAVTSVGARPAVAMAAAQAGISRISIYPDDEDDESACNIAQISTLALEDVSARGRALLQVAVDQALAPLPGPSLGTTALLVCVAAPPRFDAGLAMARLLSRRYPEGALPELETDTAHGSAALFALERALRPLARGEIDFALCAGIDVRNDPPSLVKGMADERVIGPARSFGHVPGEAASAVLLAGERALQRLGLPSRGTVVAAATAREPHPQSAGAPCLGTGVSQAVRQVLSRLPPDARVDSVTCDLNGERHRTDEWGFTITRVLDRLRDPSGFVAPATAWGDCGAANGPLLLALAAASAARDTGGQHANGGAHLLVWTAAEGDERAATLVRAAAPPARIGDEDAWGGGGSPAGAHRGRVWEPSEGSHLEDANPPQAPAWARELDAEILTEMADECAFRYEQRAYQTRRLSGEELVEDWRAVDRIEEILGTLARGLAECGAQAREIVTAKIDPESPGSVYTAARTLLTAGQLPAVIALATAHVPADAALADAVRFAFRQGDRNGATLEPDLRALVAAGPALAPLAVEVAAAMAAPITPNALSVAAGALAPSQTVSFLRALGQIATPEARALIASWNDAGVPEDPAVRRELAMAEIRAGVSAPHVVLANAVQDPALLLPAALLVDARQAGRFLGHLATRTPAGADALLAAGLAGDIAAVPWLLDRLGDEDPSNEALAMTVTALELLLGAAPTEPHEIPDPGDETAPPLKIRRIARARAVWAAVADPIVARHRDADVRLRAGGPATAAATVSLLVRPHLPILARRYLAHELAVRYGVRRPFDPLETWSTQRLWIFAAESAAQRMPPGSWDMAR
jgi:3-oxoacyl-[acyl-carrier-protein] synthase-1